jgi:hypothetical protein
VTLQVNLKGYQGNVDKSATVFSNDAQQPQINIRLKGKIKTYIELKPSNVVHFRGSAEQLSSSTIDMISTSESFHIQKVESNLEEKISYQLETVEAGKHYRLHVTNKAQYGNYSGFIKCLTDHPQRPEIQVTVSAYIQGEISVNPLALLVGRTAADQPLRTGSITILNTRNKPFQITKLTYDAQLIQVLQEALPDQTGYTLAVTPKLETIPQGEARITNLTIETDVKADSRQQVRINVVHQ